MSRKKPRFTLARLHQLLYPPPKEQTLSEYQALPARIDRVSRLLNQAHDLPYVPLSPMDRQRHGGQLFERAPEFVDAMVESLLRDPAAFSDAPHSGAEIAARQAAADAWRGYASHLFGLAFAAQKTYLYEQAGAVSMSRACLDRARARLSQPISRAERLHLIDLLRLPLLILDQVHGERVSHRPRPRPQPRPRPEDEGRAGHHRPHRVPRHRHPDRR